MTLIVDAHADIAWNMLTYGRDYTRPAMETRRLEAGSKIVEENDDCTIGWPDYQRGQVSILFSTLFASPARRKTNETETQVYKTFDEAYRLYRGQGQLYHQLADSHPDKFCIIRSTSDLSRHLEDWQTPKETGHPVGLVFLIEGADCIRKPDELREWHELGVRLIGPAWVGTRYSGGWKEPGPLTDEGRTLLKAMADFNFTLDLSHMDEQAALEALDLYRGPIVGTHANCLALMPGYDGNRQFSDRVISGIIERDGVVGLVPFNGYLVTSWKRGKNRREEVLLDVLAAHIDHICQLAGDSLHAGIGSDFDGGFGLQSIPHGMDTIADLQDLNPLLIARGYSETDVTNILGGNWLARLKRDLPTT